MAHPQGRYICKVNLIIWKIKNIYKRVTWKLLQEKLSCFFLCLVSFLLSKLVSNILVFYLRKLLIDFFIILHSDKGFGAINSMQLVNWISWRIAFGRGGQRKCPEKSLSVCNLTNQSVIVHVCVCSLCDYIIFLMNGFIDEVIWAKWLLTGYYSLSKVSVKQKRSPGNHGLDMALPFSSFPSCLEGSNLHFCALQTKAFVIISNNGPYFFIFKSPFGCGENWGIEKMGEACLVRRGKKGRRGKGGGVWGGNGRAWKFYPWAH